MKVVRPGTAPGRGAAQRQGPWWKIQITPTVTLVAIVVAVVLIYGIYWFTHRGGAAGMKMIKLSQGQQQARFESLPPDIQQQLREGTIDWSEIPSQTMVQPMQGSQAAQAQGAQTPQAPR